MQTIDPAAEAILRTLLTVREAIHLAGIAAAKPSRKGRTWAQASPTERALGKVALTCEREIARLRTELSGQGLHGIQIPPYPALADALEKKDGDQHRHLQNVRS